MDDEDLLLVTLQVIIMRGRFDAINLGKWNHVKAIRGESNKIMLQMYFKQSRCSYIFDQSLDRAVILTGWIVRNVFLPSFCYNSQQEFF